MWTRAELKARAKDAFKRNYWSCVLVALVMALVSGGAASSSGANSAKNANTSGGYYGDVSDQQIMLFMAVMGVIMVIALASMVFNLLVGNALLVGGARFFVMNQTETPRAGLLGFVFKSGHYGNVILIMFLRGLFIGLWTLLLVVPGIIKTYEYRMIPFILAENPGMSRIEAFAISKKMMTGQKWNAFVLDLSFIGWWLLAAVTCGILGLFYVQPYVEATNAELYTANKAMAYSDGYIK